MEPKVTRQVKNELVLQLDLARAFKFIRQHRTKLILACIGIYLYQNENVKMSLNLSGQPNLADAATAYWDGEGAIPMNTSLLGSGTKPAARKLTAVRKNDNPANTFSNLAKKKDTARDKEVKRKKQLAYVKEYAAAAQTEMDKHGIPASVTLAQGLLESNVGESSLASKNNNHFGIKCFSRSCKKGHCSNFTDDSHKDFFRIYKSPEDSYRAHSQLLQGGRYKKLYKLKKSDYKGWAYGLKRAGYATDPHYAEKLIGLIEDLNLHRYD